MKVKIELLIDAGDTSYADACAYFRYQYGTNTELLVEHPDDENKAEAVETVVLDILSNELREHDATFSWRIESSFVTANPS